MNQPTVATMPATTSAEEIAARRATGAVLVLSSLAETAAFAGRLQTGTWTVYVEAGMTEILRTDDPGFFDAGMRGKFDRLIGVALFVLNPTEMRRAGVTATPDGVARFRLHGPSVNVEPLLSALANIDADTAAALRSVADGRRS